VKSPTFVGVDFSMNLCTSYVSPLNIKCMFGFGCFDIWILLTSALRIIVKEY
jgi:hypothetical protein